MILVTGGTGLVGSHLLYALVQRGQSVRAIHRKGSDLSIAEKVFSYYTEDATTLTNKIEWVCANLIDIPRLEEVFQGITHVYHAAAYIDFNPKNYQKLKKSNIEGTANIVNLCLSHGIKKLCYVSSIATLGDVVDKEMVTETSYWNPEAKNSVYAITKYGAEMEVWRGTQEGLNAIIVNPGVILGEGIWHKGSGSIIKRISKGMSYYTPGGIGLVDVIDVVEAMLVLMESTHVNERYILVAENKKYKEFLTSIAQLLQVKEPTKMIAHWKLVFLSKLDWFSSIVFNTKRSLLRTHVDSLYKNEVYDGSKIEEAIAFKYTPYENTITRITRNFQQDLN